MKSLRYCHQTAHMKGESDHPQQVMEALEINYKRAIPQSLANQWWFLFCDNIPNILPEFLTVADINPSDIVGFGLSQEDADNLQQFYTKG